MKRREKVDPEKLFEDRYLDVLKSLPELVKFASCLEGEQSLEHLDIEKGLAIFLQPDDSSPSSMGGVGRRAIVTVWFWGAHTHESYMYRDWGDYKKDDYSLQFTSIKYESHRRAKRRGKNWWFYLTGNSKKGEKSISISIPKTKVARALEIRNSK